MPSRSQPFCILSSGEAAYRRVRGLRTLALSCRMFVRSYRILSSGEAAYRRVRGL